MVAQEEAEASSQSGGNRWTGQQSRAQPMGSKLSAAGVWGAVRWVSGNEWVLMSLVSYLDWILDVQICMYIQIIMLLYYTLYVKIAVFYFDIF